MSVPKQRPGRSEQTVETPDDLLRAVCMRFGRLLYDMASSEDNAKAFTGFSNSLDDDWPVSGNLWCNPPFADLATWAAKCAAWRGTCGARLLLLTPASVGANWFRKHVHGKAMVLALSPRVTFAGHKAPYPKDLILSVYGEGPGFDCWRWKP